jgi:ribosomal protein S4
METILVTAANKKQFSLVTFFLEQTNIRFQLVKPPKKTKRKIKMTKEEYGEMLEEARKSKGYPVTDEYIQSLLK